MTIDLAAERALYAARRERAALEARARLLLSGRWHLDTEGISAAIGEEYPQLKGDGAAALLQAVLELQERERPRRIPVDAVDVKMPEPEDPRVEIDRGAGETWEELQKDVLEGRRETKAPRATTKPETEEAMGHRMTPARMRKLIRITLESEPGITQTECRRLIEKQTGCAPINTGTFQPHWKRVRAEMGLGTGDERPANRPEPLDSSLAENGVEEAPSEAETSEDDQVWRDDAIKALGELRPIIPTFDETGQGALYRPLDYLRLEQEPSGDWVLSASITFEEADAAHRALARLVGS